MKRPFIETGKITAPHGVRGEVRVQPWCDTPEDLTRWNHPDRYIQRKRLRMICSNDEEEKEEEKENVD